MNIKLLIRPSLTIIFGFIGALIAKNSTPPVIFDIVGEYFLVVAAVAFGTLGFILPDILELAGKAGIAAVASQIVSYLPKTRASAFSFRRKDKVKRFENPMVVDTSALIDGRLVEIARTGFVFGTFLIIPSVIGELHKLSDNADDLKRGKGRRGLANIEALQKDKKVKVEILKSEPKEKDVDNKLVALAKSIGGKVVTVDFNLNKVASINKVPVLNVNELANAVKTPVLPTQRLRIKVTAKGKEKDQGVGYLEDGTMVVVEGASRLKGSTVDVEVLRVLQTVAGKMIFAKQAS